jgi:hypothetical protein
MHMVLVAQAVLPVRILQSLNVLLLMLRKKAGGNICRENLEARGGIEPPIKVLQTFALPLGDRAPSERSRLRGAEPLLHEKSTSTLMMVRL